MTANCNKICSCGTPRMSRNLHNTLPAGLKAECSIVAAACPFLTREDDLGKLFLLGGQSLEGIDQRNVSRHVERA